MREIEVKVKVENLQELEEKLKSQGCVFADPVSQHDVIYEKVGGPNLYEDAKEGNIVLRIRRQPNKVEFNLKQQKSGEMDNIEYETKVDDPESLHQILLLLGWRPQVEVKKNRKKGKLDEYTICLDQVERLGTFMEIEKLTDDNADPTAV